MLGSYVVCMSLDNRVNSPWIEENSSMVSKLGLCVPILNPLPVEAPQQAPIN